MATFVDIIDGSPGAAVAADINELYALARTINSGDPLPPAIQPLFQQTTIAGVRSQLGLGTAATLSVGTVANSVVQLDAQGRLPAVDGSLLINLPGGTEYTLPIATANVLGGVKIGSGISVSGDGTISAQAQAGTGTDLTWNPATSILESSTGNNATLTLVVAGGNAGLMSGAQATLLASALQPDDIINFETTTQLNSRDTANRARANHTGTQLASTISDFSAAVNAVTGTLGTAAALNVGTSANNIPQLDGQGRLPAVDGSLLTNLPGGGGYTLPTATAEILGGVKIGSGVTITDGVISVDPIAGTGTDLVYVPETRTITSSSGTDAILTEVVAGGNSGLMTGVQATKLAGIADGAEVNVNADWNASSGDAQILNKPTLGTASAQDVGFFATAAQGTLADSAVQPGDLATVATTGAFSDLSGTPTLGTAAALDVGTAENNVVQLGAGGALPALDASALTDISYNSLDDLPTLFNPAEPGAIGGTTPAAVTATTVTAGAFVATPSIVVDDADDRTLALGDAGKVIFMTNATASTITLPELAAGFGCTVYQYGAGTATFAGSGVTVRRKSGLGLAIDGQYSAVQVFYRTATEVLLTGGLAEA